MPLELVFGNKNYSTWSLRPWLLLRHFNVPFKEQRLSLFTTEARQKLKPISPTGCVPVLLDGEFAIWDSLAICEYVSEQYLAGKGWPAAVQDRARARSLAAEMHSGFQALRNHWPMNLRLQRKLQPTEEVQRNIDRIEVIWNECLHKSGGPWLFGSFSIVDAMFAPVALRFYSYQPELSAGSRQYLHTILQHPAVKEWRTAGQAETEIIKEDEVAWLLGEMDFA